MNIEIEIILKIFILLGVIYLLTMCMGIQENFANIETLKINNPIELTMFINDVAYSFISFDQLKQIYKKMIISTFSKNKDFVDFKENITNLNKGEFIKTPVFIVKTSELSQLIDSDNNKLEFKLLLDSVPKYALIPVLNSKIINDKYLYYDDKLNMLYYVKEGISNSDNIIHITNDGFVKNFSIVPDPELSDLKLNNFNYNKKINEKNKIKIQIN